MYSERYISYIIFYLLSMGIIFDFLRPESKYTLDLLGSAIILYCNYK